MILPPVTPPAKVESLSAADADIQEGTTNDRQLHRRLTLNAVSNITRYGISVVVAFFMTPFVIRTLGDSLYGYWVVLLSFAGYAGILEMGVQPAVVKLVAENKGSGDPQALARIINTALLYFLSVGIAAGLSIVVLLIGFGDQMISDAPSIDHKVLLVAILGFDIVLMFLSYVFSGVLYGWQMYHAKNVVDTLAILLNACVVFSFLRTHSLLTLAAAKVGTDLMALFATLAICYRVVPDFGWAPRIVTKRSMLELFSFGGRVFVSGTATRLANSTYPVIIASMVSATATTLFAIPTNLVAYATQIGWTLSTSFMPAFSELAAQGKSHLVRSITMRYSRYIIYVTLPVLALIFVYGPPFIALWIGPAYASAGRTTLYLLTGAALVEGLQPLLWRLLIGVGRVNFVVAVSAVSSVLSIVLAIVLVRPFGIAGVAFGVLVGRFIAQIISSVYLCQYLGVPIAQFAKEVQLPPLIAGTFLSVVAVILSLELGHDSYVQLFWGTALALLCYVVFAFFITLDIEERTWIVDRLKSVRSRYFGSWQ